MSTNLQESDYLFSNFMFYEVLLAVLPKQHVEKSSNLTKKNLDHKFP